LVIDELDAVAMPPDLLRAIRSLNEPAIAAVPLVLAVLMIRLGRLNEAFLEQLLVGMFGSASRGYGEPWVLATLTLIGPPHRSSPTALCRMSLLTSGGMTKTLRGLESAGLVRRYRSPDDRRSLLVELTPKGRNKGRALLVRLSTRYAELFAVERGPARTEAYLVLRSLLSRLEETVGERDSENWIRIR
jgi:DNA-binding MarR family transcriptional regulator